MIRTGQLNIQRARRAQETILQAAVAAGLYLEAQMKLAVLQNEISQGDFAATIEVPVELNDSETPQTIAIPRTASKLCISWTSKVRL
jgi:hypothetical protein